MKLRIDSDNKQKMLEKRIELEAEKQKYRQAPEDSAVFVVHVSGLSKFAYECDSGDCPVVGRQRLTR